MHKLKCEICREEFTSSQPHAKVCSEECRITKFSRRWGRRVTKDRGLSNNTIGTISEMLVVVDLMRKGWSVFRAVSFHCFCDVVAIKNCEVMNIEVRTGYKGDSGLLSFPRILRGPANVYAVVERNLNEINYLKTENLEKINP